MTIQTPLAAALFVSAALAAPLAVAAVEVGDVVGTDLTAIEAALTEAGYVVEEIEAEDDELSVDAALDGVEYEIEISRETGAVTEIERDDD